MLIGIKEYIYFFEQKFIYFLSDFFWLFLTLKITLDSSISELKQEIKNKSPFIRINDMICLFFIKTFTYTILNRKKLQGQDGKKNFSATEGWGDIFLGSVLVYDFCIPPPPINFVHDHLFFSKFIIFYFFIIQGQVRLRHFLGRALRLGQVIRPKNIAHLT